MPKGIKNKIGNPLKIEVEGNGGISTTAPSAPLEIEKKEETVTITKTQFDDIQNKLKMLYEVADKGRVFNYENSTKEKKPFRVKLSKFADGIIVGWRTVKDELVKHPTTGLTVGENQEYELIILDNEGKQKKVTVASYLAFSNARYDTRIDAEIVSKSEGYDGEITFDVKLDDGRVIKLNAKFVN